MGQRSQIYVRLTENEKVTLLANYYQWNYGDAMVSRARSGIEHIKSYMDNDNINILCYNKTSQEKLRKYFDVDFDTRKVTTSMDIIKDYNDSHTQYNLGKFNDYVFEGQDNNDGKLFIDINYNTKTIKYCFTNWRPNRPLRAREYLKWDMQDVENYAIDEVTEENIQFINKNAKLMTKEELQEFITTDYSMQYEEELPMF
jgi:hypothetical protein